MQLPQNNKSDERESEIKNCLQTVFDPELDESIIDLNFVSKLEALRRKRSGSGEGSKGKPWWHFGIGGKPKIPNVKSPSPSFQETMISSRIFMIEICQQGRIFICVAKVWPLNGLQGDVIESQYRMSFKRFLAPAGN